MFPGHTGTPSFSGAPLPKGLMDNTRGASVSISCQASVEVLMGIWVSSAIHHTRTAHSRIRSQECLVTPPLAQRECKTRLWMSRQWANFKVFPVPRYTCS